jgi:hypothetical protein
MGKEQTIQFQSSQTPMIQSEGLQHNTGSTRPDFRAQREKMGTDEVNVVIQYIKSCTLIIFDQAS